MKYLVSSAFRPVLTKTVWLVNREICALLNDILYDYHACACVEGLCVLSPYCILYI